MGGENRRYCNPKDLWRGYAILCIGFLYKSTNWGKGSHIGPFRPEPDSRGVGTGAKSGIGQKAICLNTKLCSLTAQLRAVLLYTFWLKYKTYMQLNLAPSEKDHVTGYGVIHTNLTVIIKTEKLRLPHVSRPWRNSGIISLINYYVFSAEELTKEVN